MLANAQRDGHPAEYRWRPLFNAAKFGWRPLLECRAVMLPRCETCWNLLGYPKLTNRSQLLVGWSSRYCEGMYRRYCCSTSFFPIVDTCLTCKDIDPQSCAMVPTWRIFGNFFGPAFPASHVQRISHMRSKFAVRPHHVWKYGRHQCATAEIRRGKEKNKLQDENMMSASATQGGHNQSWTWWNLWKHHTEPEQLQHP